MLPGILQQQTGRRSLPAGLSLQISTCVVIYIL